MPAKTSQERPAVSAALRSTPVRLIAECSQLKPAHVRRLIRQLPDAANPRIPRSPIDRAAALRGARYRHRCKLVCYIQHNREKALSPRLEEAKKFLRNVLADGPVDSGSVRKKATEAGISEKT